MTKKIYQYTDDSWEEGFLCEPKVFECYNAVDWEQNGSANSLWDLYVDVIVAHKAEESGDDYDILAENAYYLYEGFTLEELMMLCDRMGVSVEVVE